MHEAIFIQVDAPAKKARILVDDERFEVELKLTGSIANLVIEYEDSGVNVYWFDENKEQSHAMAKRVQIANVGSESF